LSCNVHRHQRRLYLYSNDTLTEELVGAQTFTIHRERIL
jgi:hypothetical protein